MAKWLAYLPFDLSTRVRVALGVIFQKNKLTERSLKCACYSVDWMVTEWWLKCDWKPPFPSPFSRHSAPIQSPISRLKGEISFCADSLNGPVIFLRRSFICMYKVWELPSFKDNNNLCTNHIIWTYDQQCWIKLSISKNNEHFQIIQHAKKWENQIGRTVRTSMLVLYTM